MGGARQRVGSGSDGPLGRLDLAGYFKEPVVRLAQEDVELV